MGESVRWTAAAAAAAAARLLVIVMGMVLLNLRGDGNDPRGRGAVQAQQFGLIHKYHAARGWQGDGFSLASSSRGDHGLSREYNYETLKTHDRRRLAAVLDFPLTGDDSVFITGLYYTQITLGTPPRQYSVQVDTGSDVMWLKCAPCPNCPLRTDIEGITLTQYDPSQSSTDEVLQCASADCVTASSGGEPTCTAAPTAEACAYSIVYGDGSSTSGYLMNDMMTFTQVENSTNTNGTASVYFGCGYNQTGNLLSESRAVDGLIGFGQAAISVPTQLANQKKTGRVFAHCLQGDNLGGGTMVIGNILEPNIVYTPIVPRQSHYSIKLENIAVNGMNITTPAAFEVTPGGLSGGVIIDSGTTLAYLVQPVYDQFVAEISSNAPVPAQQFPDSSGSTMTCFVYSGSIVETFPQVNLFFDGGAVMNLGPKNYLFQEQLASGATSHCIGWMPSSSPGGYQAYTIFGGIVLKDQLIVYDNDKQRVGWKPFDCTKPVSVSTPNGTDAMTVLPGSPDANSPRPRWSNIFGAQDVRTRMSPYVFSSCLALALAFLATWL